MNLKKTLPFFSYLFHPIFIPVFAALYYFIINHSKYTNFEKYFVVLQIVIITIVLPILFFLLLHKMGKINSVLAVEIEQRKIPLVIQCFLIIFLVRKSVPLENYPELHFFFLGGLLSALVALILLFFKIKASLHMIAISALTVFVVGLSLQLQIQNIVGFTVMVLLNSLVASSRLKMKAHSIKELIIGFILGIVPQVALWFLWL